MLWNRSKYTEERIRHSINIPDNDDDGSETGGGSSSSNNDWVFKFAGYGESRSNTAGALAGQGSKVILKRN